MNITLYFLWRTVTPRSGVDPKLDFEYLISLLGWAGRVCERYFLLSLAHCHGCPQVQRGPETKFRVLFSRPGGILALQSVILGRFPSS